MESTVELEREAGKTVPESEAPSDLYTGKLLMIDLFLRVLLFASTLTAVLIMVTSKQVALVSTSFFGSPVPQSAKFNKSPAFIYFVVALSVVCLYGVIAIITSLCTISKPSYAKKLLFYLTLVDVLMLGLVASATGTAGGVGYIGFKGNSQVGWAKICSIYDKFCQYTAGSIAMSLFASILLVLLVMKSTYFFHCLSS